MLEFYLRLPLRERSLQHPWLSLCLVSSLFLIGGCGARHVQGSQDSQYGAFERIKQEKVLKVGFSGFPPYTILDPNCTDPNKRVSGFAADLVYEIANRSSPPLKVEWYKMNWDTLAADMHSRKFDFIADPVYVTVSKALEFRYTDPYSYFGVALGLVRQNEERFKSFSDLDRDNITVAIAEGWVSTDYAREHLHKAKLKIVPVEGDSFAQLDDVLMGRADIALQDSPSVVQYVKAHPGKVKILWLEHPPCLVPGGFTVRQEDGTLQDYLNTCLRLMRADGTINRLDDQWKTYGYFEKLDLQPAKGLSEFLQSKR